MTNLTDPEREALTDFFFEAEVAWLVEFIFAYTPEDMLKEMGVNILQARNE